MNRALPIGPRPEDDTLEIAAIGTELQELERRAFIEMPDFFGSHAMPPALFFPEQQKVNRRDGPGAVYLRVMPTLGVRLQT